MEGNVFDEPLTEKKRKKSFKGPTNVVSVCQRRLHLQTTKIPFVIMQWGFKFHQLDSSQLHELSDLIKITLQLLLRAYAVNFSGIDFKGAQQRFFLIFVDVQFTDS